MNREQLQPKSSPSDIPETKGYASSLKGGLPSKKRRISPFDKLGARQWEPQKGEQSKSYAG